MPKPRRRAMWIVVALVAVVGAVAGTVVAVPNARGALADAIFIAGLRFNSQPAIGPGSGVVHAPRTGQMSLEEAMRLYSFDVPTWSPEGFTLDRKRVAVSDLSIPGFSAGEALIELEWRNVDARVIRLSVQRTDPTVKHDDVVAPGTVKQITINGKPAAAIMGTWDESSGRWASDGLVVLSWRQGNDIYDLMGESIGELISMAESMPHFQTS